MNVRSARLDRDGHAESTAELDRGDAVGEEELRGDDVERKLRADPREQRSRRRDQRARMEAAAGGGQVVETRAIDGEPVPSLVLGQGSEGGVARDPRERAGRQPARRDDAHRDIAALGQRARLALDEDAEIGPRRIGEERREDEHAEHGARL